MLQKLVEQNRRHFEGQREAFRAIARDIIGNAQEQLATALKLEPAAFAQVPDDTLDRLLSASHAAKALEEIPGTQINITFTSELTVNGVSVPHGDSE
ncbi:hypothetical protein RHEC894_CH01020 [Rhizobium sp. CIAT894]|uniref:hypothetical protein n=1 Tax=Rhizobium sp. CIAT894 TaxID=2020312 RepID=UPI000301AF93|nr:hypothetical protein [Rhizobium sp. CIAT894]ARM87360.1 hypothetical protein RHEC894_CH01020 [Rhizobium sp. CIAT894]